MPPSSRIRDRAAFILDTVERQGTASYEALAESLRVSTMTARRDCEELVRLGKVLKTIGGIQQAHAPAYLYENAVRERIASNRAEKQAIAVKALDLIQNNQTVFIDGGTTNRLLARLIAERCTGLTILTNSALTCLELSKGQNTIIGIGGEYDPMTLSFVGSQAEQMAKSFFVEQAFLTTKGFLPTDGTYESAVATFRIKQIIAERAVETILLVDHTKFGHRALSKVLDISQIQHVVTDEVTAKSDLRSLGRAGINVNVATLTKAHFLQDGTQTNQ
ncbi:MAG TPA: DeoR/GlpR family DNA-binding transcription regulator [Chthoniobacterales bacterium]|nr:DeoR/GlpR family DNA-binding transcription regulator [Chthoniobacterales bacterium]